METSETGELSHGDSVEMIEAKKVFEDIIDDLPRGEMNNFGDFVGDFFREKFSSLFREIKLEIEISKRKLSELSTPIKEKTPLKSTAKRKPLSDSTNSKEKLKNRTKKEKTKSRKPIPKGKLTNRVCSQCGTKETSAWRRNSENLTVCNRCGVQEMKWGRKTPSKTPLKKGPFIDDDLSSFLTSPVKNSKENTEVRSMEGTTPKRKRRTF